MSDIVDPKTIGSPLDTVSRRAFIKGVIAGGAVVSSTGYLFRASTLLAQTGGAAGERLLTLNVNGQQRRVDVMKQMVEHVPDAGSYAPVTILIDERPDGVHLSYDTMSSFLSSYGSPQAMKVAQDLDSKVEALLNAAAS